jgi:hypothetical protein
MENIDFDQNMYDIGGMTLIYSWDIRKKLGNFLEEI